MKKPAIPKFCNAWLQNPEFKEWLKMSVYNDKNKAFCKVFMSEIICYNKGSLKRHAKSRRHKSNIFETCKKSCN